MTVPSIAILPAVRFDRIYSQSQVIRAIIASRHPPLNHGVSVQFEVKVGGRVMMSVRKTFVVRLPIFKIVDSRFDFDYLAV